MEKNAYLNDLIESRNAVILCRNKEEVYMLADAVEAIYPSYGRLVRERAMFLNGNTKYLDGICIRIDLLFEYRLDVGHSGEAWYRNKGRNIVSYSDLLFGSGEMDFGEIEANAVDVGEFLFGVTKF